MSQVLVLSSYLVGETPPKCTVLYLFNVNIIGEQTGERENVFVAHLVLLVTEE
jgi:hypothetical protein